MRRDLDLIRKLMLRLEEIPLRSGLRMAISARDDRMQFSTHGSDEVAYHLDQIKQSGFVNDGGIRPASGIGFAGFTPEGHDFIDSVRDVDAWAATKDRASKVGSFSLGFLTDLAKAWAKSEAAKLGWM